MIKKLKFIEHMLISIGMNLAILIFNITLAILIFYGGISVESVPIEILTYGIKSMLILVIVHVSVTTIIDFKEALEDWRDDENI